jgi:hypothetical protein
VPRRAVPRSDPHIGQRCRREAHLHIDDEVAQVARQRARALGAAAAEGDEVSEAALAEGASALAAGAREGESWLAAGRADFRLELSHANRAGMRGVRST